MSYTETPLIRFRQRTLFPTNSGDQNSPANALDPQVFNPDSYGSSFSAKDYLSSKIDNMRDDETITYDTVMKDLDLTLANRDKILIYLAGRLLGSSATISDISSSAKFRKAVEEYQTRFAQTKFAAKHKLGGNYSYGLRQYVDAALGKKTLAALIKVDYVALEAYVNETQKQEYEAMRDQYNSSLAAITVDPSLRAKELSPGVLAFLDTIAAAEGTDKYPPAAQYRVMFGGNLFDNQYGNHPRILNSVITKKGNKLSSRAAGRYQFMPPTWDRIADILKLEDFSPANQDRAAWFLALGKGVTEQMIKDDPEKAFLLVSGVWAAIPTSAGKSRYKNQQARTMDYMLKTMQAKYKQRIQIGVA